MKFFLLTLILVLSQPSQALDIQAFVDKNELSLNESFVFTIKLQSQKSLPKGLDMPDLSHQDNFYLLNQWSGRESSINWINGQMEKTASISKNYRLQPKKTGVLKIPTFRIQANGKVFSTSVISITVHKEASPSSPKKRHSPSWPPSSIIPPSYFDLFEDPFSKKELSSNPVHLLTRLNKKSVYKSEGIRVDWIILQSSSSGNYSVYQKPSLKGFWKEELKNKHSRSLGTELREQVLYRKTLLESQWLFPLRTGELVIDPYAIKAEKIFGFRFQEQVISSSAQNVLVKNLPTEGRDHSFTGAVGDWAIKALLSDSTVKVGQPLSYKIIFEGSGHPRFISLPELELPSSVQTYPPVAKSFFFDSGKGRKEFEVLIIPQKEGTLVIPSQSLSVFDSSTGKYILQKTDSFSLSVQKGKIKNQDQLTFFEEEKGGIPPLLDPISTNIWPRFINHKNLMIFWLSFLVFALLINLILLVILLRNKFRLQKKSSLKEKVEREFKSIRAYLDKKNWRKAGAGMIQVNYLLLSSSPTPTSSLGWRQALEKLPLSQNKKYFTEFENLFKDLETLSFAPQSPSEETALKQAQSLLKRSETLAQAFLSKK